MKHTDRSYQLITLSGRSVPSVREAVRKLQGYLEKKEAVPLGDLAFTYQVGREAFAHRLTLTAGSREELLALCERAAATEWSAPKHSQGISYGQALMKEGEQVAFLFTGQGAQYGGMGRELYLGSSVFREALDECAAILEGELPHPLLDYLFDEQRAAELNETEITQPALFAVEYALAQLWMSWGIKPSAVMGHSLGEYVAACVAGALSLRDGLLLVAARGRLMQELCERGAMVSVMAKEAEVEEVLAELRPVDDISLSAVNSDRQTVVAGRPDAVDAFCQLLAKRQIVHKRLPVSHAFHSPLMEPMLEAFRTRLEKVAFQALQIPLISNLSGEALTGNALSADYWLQHLRQPVRFGDGLRTLAEQASATVWLEVGPHPVLKRLADAFAGETRLVVGSLKRDEDGWKAIQDHLGQLWAQGVSIDWRAFHRDHKRKRLRVPTYAFDLKPYWLDVDRSGAAAGAGLPQNAASLFGKRAVATASSSASETAASAATGALANGNKTEQLLAALWQEVLGVAGVDLQDDFFELGGDSLNVIQLQSRIREQTGAEVEFQQFFRHTSLTDLAKHLDEIRGVTHEDNAGDGEGNIVEGITGGLVDGSAGIISGDIPTAPQADFYPLSHAQQRMWLLEQLQPGSAAYNIANAVKLTGALDADLLEKGLQEVVKRHEALRTVFRLIDGTPMQAIRPAEEAAAAITLTRTDLASAHAETLPEAAQNGDSQNNSTDNIVDNGSTQHGATLDEDRDATLDHFFRREAARPFDLTEGPLLRAVLIRTAPDEHILLLTMHHIISDGWSMGVLVRELSALYTTLAAGEKASLPPLAVQYKDFAAWARDWVQGDHVQAQLAYWKQKLQGDLPILQLPTDRPRPAEQTDRGATHRFRIPKALAERLEALSREEGATIYMTLLAAFNVLLHRYTGQEDLLVGSPVAARNRRGIEPLIGMFVNTLVLRTELTGDVSFRTLLRQVRETVLEANARQDVPFEVLVGEVQPNRPKNYTPLFQAMFVLQNTPMPTLEQPGLTLAPLDVDNGTAKYDITLMMTADGDGYQAGLEYNTDLFDPATAERMAAHFSRLLEAVAHLPERAVAHLPERAVAHLPERAVAHLPLLPDAERDLVVTDWNRTATAYPKTESLATLFEAQAEAAPDRIALTFEGNSMTYRELNEQANRLARRLQKAGVASETPVGVSLERSFDLIVALLAIVKSGGAYVPLDPDYPAERLAYMLEDTEPKVLLTAQHLHDRLPLSPASQTQVIRLDHEAERAQIQAESPADLHIAATPDQLAYIMYTSGSTGRPKGVRIPQRGIIRLVKETDYARFGPEEVFLQFAPVAFDASTFEIWGALLNGSRLALYPNQPPTLDELGRVIREEGITTLWLTAGLFHQMIDHRPSDFRHVRQLLAGGDVLSPAHVKKALEVMKAGTLINGYGPTENTTFTCCHPMTDPTQVGATVLIGRPIRNTTVYILDPAGQPVPVGIPGELYIGGDGLALGYHNQPELTAETFVPHPLRPDSGERLYRTGDLVRYLPDGAIEFLGRTDYQVKIRGFRIELGEIEALLMQHPAAQETVVLAREEAPGDKRLVAYVKVSDPSGTTTAELHALAQAKLPAYMVPSAIVLLEEFPLNANGKVDRRALPTPDYGTLEQACTPPRTATEQTLAAIYAEVLHAEKVGLESDFFTLGGHSLLAMQLISRARETFHVDLTMRHLFDTPTLEGLARKIDTLSQTAALPPLTPVERGETMPVSFAQERLWLIEKITPGTNAYNIPIAVRLTGALDQTALEQSLHTIVQRHEVLRTTFADHNGQPVQQIDAEAALPIAAVNLQHLPDEGRRREADRLALQEAQQPFDLEKGSLVRALLLQLQPDEHLLLLTMHHIVSDGWSMGVLVRELTELYRARTEGRTPALPELPVQYADYAHWQRQWLQADVLDQQLDYWKQTLGTSLPILQLPTDRPRPAVRTARGGVCTRRLPKDLSDRLAALSKQEDATLFMTLLTAFNVLLHRYSGQDDIVVGTPIAGRSHAQIEPLIGFFVNTLALRTQLSPDMSFRDLLQQVRETALGAYAHQDIPFEKLVEALQPARDRSYTPLFQVMFALQDAPLERAELPGLTLAPYENMIGTAKFDLTLTMTESEDGLTSALEYNLDLFDETTVERMLAHLSTLLAAVAEQPEQALSQLPLLAKEEMSALLAEWNREPVEHPQHLRLHHLFEAQVERTPDATAVVFGDTRLTYLELNEQANRVAHRLLALRGNGETVVGLLMERSPEMVIGMYGILKAGQAYLPLDPSLPADRLAFMIEDANVQAVLATDTSAAQLPTVGNGTQLILLDHKQTGDGNQAGDQFRPHPSLLSESTENPNLDIPAERLAYVIYTSGSTGKPKGVMIPHRAIVNHMCWMQADYPLTAHDRILQKTPFGFDASVWEFHAPLLAGAQLIMAEPGGHQDSAYLVRAVIDHGITRLQLVPSMLQAFLEEPNLAQCTSLKHLFCGGEALPAEAVTRCHERLPHVELHNLYGPTEACIDATVWDCARDETARNIPIGRPVHNTQIYILDRHLHPVPTGVPGELYIGGAGLARGYLNRAELTEQVFIRNPFITTDRNQAGDSTANRLYKTGDLARYLPNGAFEYLGRIDHQVKIRGYRIELGEIESLLLRHPHVGEAAVIDHTDAIGIQRLVAYLVPAEGGTPDWDALSADLRTHLPEYMVPAACVLLDSLPLTHNGKLDRRALPQPELTGRDGLTEYIAPRNDLEAKVAAIWGELLQIEQIGVNDDFFALGGHSLLATMLASRVRREYQVELPLGKLFETPTVAAVAHVIEAAQQRQASGDDEPKIKARGRERRRVRN